jgi:hypothetical protein
MLEDKDPYALRLINTVQSLVSDFSTEIRNAKRRADEAIDARAPAADQKQPQHQPLAQQPAPRQAEVQPRRSVNLRIVTDHEDPDVISDPEVSLSPRSKSLRPSDKVKRETRRQVAWGSVAADDAGVEEEVAPQQIRNNPILTTPSTSTKVPGVSFSHINPGELEEHDDSDDADMQVQSEPMELSEPSPYEWEQEDASRDRYPAQVTSRRETSSSRRAERKQSRVSKPGFNNVLYRGNTAKTDEFVSPSKESLRRHIHDQKAADKVHDNHMQIHNESGGNGRSASWLLKRTQVADDGAIWISEDAAHEKKMERVDTKSIRDGKKSSQAQRASKVSAKARASSPARRTSFITFQKQHGRSTVHANGA